MSITVKNSLQMSHSQLNKSKTKQTYSFPRQTRFQNPEITSYCQNIYDLPSMRSKRSAGIGYGDRSYESSMREATPGPSYYEQTLYTTQDELNKKKGWTMGVSRERMEISGSQANTSPGPGQFNPKTTLSKVGFIMRGKPKSNLTNSSSTEPGPGSYENLPKLNLSRMSKQTTFNPHSDRFQKHHEEKNPGPGQYDNSGISPVGNYFLSNLINSQARTFGKAQIRNDMREKNTIGPGSYQLDSEFGIYEAKKKYIS